MNFIIKVWRGDAGLARTYWLFGGVLGVVFWFALGAVKPGSIQAVMAGAAFAVFMFWANMGVWRAADKYTGRPILASLGRAAAALGLAYALVAGGSVLYAAVTGSWKTDQIDWENGVMTPPK